LRGFGSTGGLLQHLARSAFRFQITLLTSFGSACSPLNGRLAEIWQNQYLPRVNISPRPKMVRKPDPDKSG
jgi:hypothetical protein